MWRFFTSIDDAAIAWVGVHRTTVVTALMRLMTFLGSPGALTVLGLLTVGLLYWRKRHREAYTVAGGLVGSWLLNELLKAFFHRARPAEPWLTHASGYSFPSGHAMVSMSFFLVVTLTLSASISSRRTKWLIVVAGVLLSLLVGASRVYLGVHYTTDVVAGFVVGAVWGLLCLVPARRWARR